LVAFAALLSAHLLLLGDAWAQPSEIEQLEAELAEGLATLSTSDCVTACLALDSMIRAAERLCELDPGPRCDEAQRKVDEAARRVHEACPDCAASRDSEDDDGTKTVTRAQEGPGEQPAQAGAADESAPAYAPGPPAEDQGAAGCAACHVGYAHDATPAPWLLLLAAALASARRRRR